MERLFGVLGECWGRAMVDKSDQGKCSVKSCENEVFIDSKCALHCDKRNHSEGLLKTFYKQLTDYISHYLSLNSEKYKNEFLELIQSLGFKSKKLKINIESGELVLNNISFPVTSFKNDKTNYLLLLQVFHSIKFEACTFWCESIELREIPELEEIPVLFQRCKFRARWSLLNYTINKKSHVIYQHCVFFDEVIIAGSDTKMINLSNPQFDFGCKFLSKLIIISTELTASLFSSEQVDDDHYLLIKEFTLNNVSIEDKFIVNNLIADKVKFTDVEFKEKFELKNAEIKEASINNCNFAKVSDFHGSKFEIFEIEKCIFSKFVGFEKCEFSKDSTPTSKNIINFKYVTFLDFASFRDSTYGTGINLGHANFKSPPNFYGATIDSTHTDRETYRIIKQSFDSVGNKLEANKYYSLELKAYKKEIFDPKNTNALLQEKIVFYVNDFGSRFGQSYLRPIAIISILMAIFMFLVLGKKRNWLYKIAPAHNEAIACFVGFFNDFSKSLIPFSKLQIEGMEFLSLLFGIAFSVLIWLTITAIKMHTKR